jgi:hypothetical protein
MDELIKLLDENLEYISHEIDNDTIYITVMSIRDNVICPYCQQPSTKVHSKYEKSFQNLPIQGKNVSSITASHLLKSGVATVSKSTVCNILKKKKLQ